MTVNNTLKTSQKITNKGKSLTGTGEDILPPELGRQKDGWTGVKEAIRYQKLIQKSY